MPDLEYIFHPKSIAVVGASSNPFSPVNYFFLDSLIKLDYEGKIYPIHPSASELSGLKVYPSILDVPDSIDLVICGIRADLTPQLMRQCVAKKVKVVQIYTSGFSETGKAQGIRLEKELAEIARQGNVRVLGPNCMGIYCPDSKISYDPSLPKESGSVGLLAQSGGNSIETVQIGEAQGIHFSKVVSFGNACDIDEAELLEYFTNDSQTKIIAGYIEGTRNGRAFFNALRKATKVKPVIMLKGGITEAGTKAAASHTGSLTGNIAIWHTLFRQSGVIQVYDLEELIDLLTLFQHLKPVRGRRVGLVGSGGGRGVLATDSCEGEGLVAPSFPPELRGKLREIVPEAADPGTSVCNPVDSSSKSLDPLTFSRILRTVADHEGIDFILGYTRVTFGARIVNRLIDSLIEVKQSVSKPITMVTCHNIKPEVSNLAFSVQERCLQAGIPAFSSFNRAARAMSKFIQYYEK